MVKWIRVLKVVENDCVKYEHILYFFLSFTGEDEKNRIETLLDLENDFQLNFVDA